MRNRLLILALISGSLLAPVTISGQAVNPALASDWGAAEARAGIGCRVLVGIAARPDAGLFAGSGWLGAES